MQRGGAGERGLQRQRLLGRDPLDVGHAIPVRLGSDLLEFDDLRSIGCDDQLAAAPIGHAVRFAVLVKEVLARDATARLERALGIVDASVDHF